MAFSIQNEPLLKKILWADATAGGLTGLLGLSFSSFLASFFGLPERLFFINETVTLGYASVAFSLAFSKKTPPLGLAILVAANWFWTLVSLGLAFFWIEKATAFGTGFLIFQAMICGGLAFLEERHLAKEG